MVNQVRVKRSIDPTKFFVDGTLTSTARKIMDLFSTRIELSRGVEQEGGYTMRVNVVANIMARPARILELPVVSGQGVDTMLDLLLFGLQLGVVERSGTWFKIDDKYRLGSGLREAARQLGEDREISSYLLDRVMVRA
jgi:recombination protein RecA